MWLNNVTLDVALTEQEYRLLQGEGVNVVVELLGRVQSSAIVRQQNLKHKEIYLEGDLLANSKS